MMKKLLITTAILISWANVSWLLGQNLQLNSPVAEPSDKITIDQLLDLVATEQPHEQPHDQPNNDTQVATASLEEEAELVEPPARPLPEPADEATKTVIQDAKADGDTTKNAKTLEVVELDGTPMTRGPVHEAFAEPIQNTPTASQVIRKAPPAAIEEIAPELPEGRNMVWISGYWAWDTQEKDYVWVSGVWRKTPKDREWVPGQWEPVEENGAVRGHQWVPGALRPTNADGHAVAKQVLPLPPKSLEQGPVSPAPSEITFGSRGHGNRTTKTTMTTLGEPATGLDRKKTGSGFRTATTGIPTAAYSYLATGTTHGNAAVPCMLLARSRQPALELRFVTAQAVSSIPING